MRGRARADGALHVADVIIELHLFAALEEGRPVAEDLHVERVGNLVAVGRLVCDARFGVSANEQGRQVKVVQHGRAARDLMEEVGAADHLVEAGEAQLGQDLANFLRNEGHEVHDLVRRAGVQTPTGQVLEWH